MSIAFALFADKAYMDMETQPTKELAKAFIGGCAHAATLYEREMTGYVLPDEETLMRQNEDDTECDRAMADYKGNRVTPP
jgi:hypothetical protein